MTNRLYFFANIGNWKKNPIGGGQTSARRVIEGFRQMGIEIIEVDRHWNVLTSKVGHFIENSFYAIINTAELFFVLLFGRRSNSAMFHISYSAEIYSAAAPPALCGFSKMLRHSQHQKNAET